jgi:hypothetical protein
LEGSIGLALQCAGTVKTLNDIAGKYNNARLAISSMVQNLDAIQLAWERISTWAKSSELDQNTEDAAFIQRLEKLLEGGTLVMDALEDDLLSYNNTTKLSFFTRSKFVFNEAILQGHQSRLRDQTISMTLVLEA